MENDTEFHDHTVSTVTRTANGWRVTVTDGLEIWVPSSQCDAAPSIGEALRVYGLGIGYTVRGIVVGGRVYCYQAPDQVSLAESMHVRAQALALAEQARTESLAAAYLAAVHALIEAQASGDLPAIWRALHAAVTAELDLTGDDAPVTGVLHQETITCEVYEPGEPCANRTDCGYCNHECPMVKRSQNAAGIKNIDLRIRP